MPRTYEFNLIIALDVFYNPLRGQSLPILNIICHGTKFQVAALTRHDGTPTAAVGWSTFQRSWRYYFGTPDVMIAGGGPGFRQNFAHFGEYAGILQITVDADAPWQNGKCGRHGCEGSFGKGSRDGSCFYIRRFGGLFGRDSVIDKGLRFGIMYVC